jgi:DNA adenine methylase
MMYLGSKRRIAKQILPVMLAERSPDQWWVEPFVGGANMLDKVDGKRLGNDSHEYLIALLIAVRDGYVPPTEISRETYYAVKRRPQEYPKELVGFVGFTCSFGGPWWGGYGFHQKTNLGCAGEGSRTLCKQAQNLKGIDFRCGDYRDLAIPANSLIYCDPPYSGTTQYRDNFDSSAFWQWCRDMSKGHTVFVSEYSAPGDFVCVKEVQHRTVLNRNLGSSRVEKLFRVNK